MSKAAESKPYALGNMRYVTCQLRLENSGENYLGEVITRVFNERYVYPIDVSALNYKNRSQK